MQLCDILVSTSCIAGLTKPVLLMWYAEKPIFPSLSTMALPSLLTNTALVDLGQTDLTFEVIA